MNFTQYFLLTREREDRKDIKIEWIEFVFYHPIFEVLQSDGRIRRWAHIEEVDKYLRIIILEDSITIHNAFFDRNFKPNELYFNDHKIVETKDLNENTLIELDENGNIVSMTIEHAKQQTEVSSFSFNQVAKMEV